MIDGREVPKQVFPHSIKGDLLKKTVVTDQADDAVSTSKPIDGPSEELDIRIEYLADAAGCGVSGVGFALESSRSVTSYLRFLLLSFSSSCPTL